jgi:hypothetical protein
MVVESFDERVAKVKRMVEEKGGKYAVRGNEIIMAYPNPKGGGWIKTTYRWEPDAESAAEAVESYSKPSEVRAVQFEAKKQTAGGEFIDRKHSLGKGTKRQKGRIMKWIQSQKNLKESEIGEELEWYGEEPKKKEIEEPEEPKKEVAVVNGSYGEW